MPSSPTSSASPLWRTAIGLPVALVVLAFVLVWADGSRWLLGGVLAMGLVMATMLIPMIRTPWILIGVLALGSNHLLFLGGLAFYLRFVVIFVLLFRWLLMVIWPPFNGQEATKSAKKAEAASARGSLIIKAGILGLLSIGLLGLPYALDVGLSFKRWVSFAMLCLLIFWSLPLALPRMSDKEAFLKSLWQAGMAIMILGLMLFVLGVPGMMKVGRLRLMLHSPNQLSHFMAMLLPLTLHFCFFPKTGASRSRPTLRWTLLAVQVGILIFSGSRGALLASGIACTLQIFLTRRQLMGKALLFVGLGLALHGLWDLFGPETWRAHPVQETLNALTRTETLSTGSGRLGVWTSAWHRFSSSPWLGFGFGSTDALFDRGLFDNIPEEFQGRHLHNGYLEELINLGVLGALTLLFVFGATALRLIQVTSANLAQGQPSIVVLGAIFWIGLLSGLVESWFTSVGSLFAFPFWTSIALIWAMPPQSRPLPEDRPRVLAMDVIQG